MYTHIGDYSRKDGGLSQKTGKYVKLRGRRDEKLLFFYLAFDIILSIENYLGGLNR